MYEDQHFRSLQSRLIRGQCVYDIGSHDGLTSVLVADAVGPENVVIIEPSEVNWSYIKKTWHESYASAPRATFPGFMDATDKIGFNDNVWHNAFPPESDRPLCDKERLEFRWMHYRNVCSIVASRPSLTIDTLVKLTEVPRGITMDVEGAEFLVLKGAEHTLRVHRPLVWVSLHPDFMKDRFHTSASALFEFMKSLGYTAVFLASDHEEHWLFEVEE